MTNRMIEKQYPILKLYQTMRMGMFDVITDEDLAFAPPNCPSLGELCVQVGEWEQSYIDSFRSFKQIFDYRQPDKEMANSTAKLKSWWEELDKELEETVTALSDEDIETKVVDRGGWEASPRWNLDLFKDCIVIFFSKAWVYLKIMEKPMPENWDNWIS